MNKLAKLFLGFIILFSLITPVSADVGDVCSRGIEASSGNCLSLETISSKVSFCALQNPDVDHSEIVEYVRDGGAWGIDIEVDGSLQCINMAPPFSAFQLASDTCQGREYSFMSPSGTEVCFSIEQEALAAHTLREGGLLPEGLLDILDVSGQEAGTTIAPISPPGGVDNSFSCTWSDLDVCVVNVNRVTCGANFEPTEQSCTRISSEDECNETLNSPLSCRQKELAQISSGSGTFSCRWDGINCVPKDETSCEDGFSSSEGACSALSQTQCASVSQDCVEAPRSISLGLAERVATLYNWALGIGGVLALGVIIYGGLMYTASGGNASTIGEAKKWITSAIFGLILLLSSYLILNILNPSLTTLKDVFLDSNPSVSAPGVNVVGGLAGGSNGTYGPIPVVGGFICREDCLASSGGPDVSICNTLPSCTGYLITPLTASDQPKLTYSSGAYYQMPSGEDSYYIGLSPSETCGQKDLIDVIYTVARRWESRFPDNPIRVGDLNGLGHSSHDHGVDVDISDRNAGSSGKPTGTAYGGDYSYANAAEDFNPSMAIELGKLFMDTNRIDQIFFSNNSSDTIGSPVVSAVNAYASSKSLSGRMAPVSGHDDHFHVRINAPTGPCSISCSALGSCNCSSQESGPQCN